jgi:hypothetical protein
MNMSDIHGDPNIHEGCVRFPTGIDLGNNHDGPRFINNVHTIKTINISGLNPGAKVNCITGLYLDNNDIVNVGTITGGLDGNSKVRFPTGLNLENNQSGDKQNIDNVNTIYTYHISNINPGARVKCVTGLDLQNNDISNVGSIGGTDGNSKVKFPTGIDMHGAAEITGLRLIRPRENTTNLDILAEINHVKGIKGIMSESGDDEWYPLKCKSGLDLENNDIVNVGTITGGTDGNSSVRFPSGIDLDDGNKQNISNVDTLYVWHISHNGGGNLGVVFTTGINMRSKDIANVSTITGETDDSVSSVRFPTGIDLLINNIYNAGLINVTGMWGRWSNTATLQHTVPGYQPLACKSGLDLHNNNLIRVNAIFYEAANTGSDDRLKHNEIDISNGLNIVRQLVPQKYQKTRDLKDPDW